MPVENMTENDESNSSQRRGGDPYRLMLMGIALLSVGIWINLSHPAIGSRLYSRKYQGPILIIAGVISVVVAGWRIVKEYQARNKN